MRKTLRQLVGGPGLIMAPGAFDTWSAKLIEEAGFPAVYMTGYGVSASLLGQPDIGLVTMTEMAEQATRIASEVSIPVIADADNGYGGVLNVVRTVREFERAGVAAVQFEDQAFPKRCGQLPGKETVSKSEMVSKLKAAVHARRSDDLLIIARTDARAVSGFDDALDRAKAYEQAGADLIFFASPRSVDEMATVAKAVHKPLMANMLETPSTPVARFDQLEGLGYKIAIFPTAPLFAATKAIQDTLRVLKREGSTRSHGAQMTEFNEFNRLAGLEDANELERAFL